MARGKKQEAVTSGVSIVAVLCIPQYFNDELVISIDLKFFRRKTLATQPVACQLPQHILLAHLCYTSNGAVNGKTEWYKCYELKSIIDVIDVLSATPDKGNNKM